MGRPSYLASAWGLLLRMQSSLAVVVSLVAVLVAVTGYSTLFLLVLTRRYTPSAISFVQPLVLDYSTPLATSVVDLLAVRTLVVASVSPVRRTSWFGRNTPPPPIVLRPVARFLPPGQKVSVEVDLRLAQNNGELFQLSGELIAQDGTVLAKTSRTYVSRPESSIVNTARQLVFLPLSLLGLYDSTSRIRMRLFDTYVEKEVNPAVLFRATLAGRGTLPPPPVYVAQLIIKLKLGIIERVLYWTCPSLPVAFLVGSMALWAAVGGTATAMLLGWVAVYLHVWGVGEAAGKAPASPSPNSGLARLPSDSSRMSPLLPEAPPLPPRLGRSSEANHDYGGYHSPVTADSAGSNNSWDDACTDNGHSAVGSSPFANQLYPPIPRMFSAPAAGPHPAKAAAYDTRSPLNSKSGKSVPPPAAPASVASSSKSGVSSSFSSALGLTRRTGGNAQRVM